MKRLGLVLCITLLMALCAFSQNNPLITLDEFGNGSLLFPGGVPIPTAGSKIADPGPGGLASVMTYNLLGPPSLVAGDLILLEPGTAIISDLIRFNPAGTGTPGYPASVVFYSDLDGGADTPADVGLPGAAYTNVVTLTEGPLPGGLFGILYTPTATQPGFVAGFSVTYDIISDTPEPAAMGMVLVGVGAMVAVRRRYRNV